MTSWQMPLYSNLNFLRRKKSFLEKELYIILFDDVLKKDFNFNFDP